MLPKLSASVVLVSGIVARHAQLAREAYAGHGFTERARMDSHGWTTMLVTR